MGTPTFTTTTTTTTMINTGEKINLDYYAPRFNNKELYAM